MLCCWVVEYVSVVLFCYILDAMLCYVWKKKMLITKKKYVLYRFKSVTWVKINYEKNVLVNQTTLSFSCCNSAPCAFTAHRWTHLNMDYSLQNSFTFRLLTLHSALTCRERKVNWNMCEYEIWVCTADVIHPMVVSCCSWCLSTEGLAVHVLQQRYLLTDHRGKTLLWLGWFGRS